MYCTPEMNSTVNQLCFNSKKKKKKLGILPRYMPGIRIQVSDMETSVGTLVTMPTIPVHEAVAPGSPTEQDGGHSGTTKGRGESSLDRRQSEETEQLTK